ncbi:MAG: hypothetical protein N3A38_04550 [Planctomycetota bacterium]|nr:hypothetical protein [Planctomycetota bacterium]
MRGGFVHVPVATLLCWMACVVTAAGEVSFARRPAVAKDGEKIRISFAVSAPTDVEVAVVDKDGNVANHLAAGVLGGPNPPPEPLKPGLEQELVWDGKDDDGKPVAGPVRILVRAGMKPEFDGFLLYNPHDTGPILSVAAGPGGRIYVFHKHSTANYNMGSHDIKIYDHDGRYVRTLKPYPADMPPERLKTIGVFQDEEGRLVPRIFNWEQLNFYPDAHLSRGRSMPDEAMPAVDSRGNVYWIAGGVWGKLGPLLMALEADGGSGRDPFVGKRILPQIENLNLSSTYPAPGEAPHLAVSGDDRYVYVSGLRRAGKEGSPVPCVFRVDTATLAGGEAFAGKPEEQGKEGALLTAPAGIAVAGGLLYVADVGADRVAVFSEKDGSFAGQISVPKPTGVGADPETGAVYVLSCAANPPSLIRFDGYRGAKELYRTTLPKGGGAYRIAAGFGKRADGVRTARIWMPAVSYGPGFYCIEDAGGKFEHLGDPRPVGKDHPPSAAGPRDLRVDRMRGELYVKISGERWFRIHEKTGKIESLGPLEGLTMSDKGTELAVCPDGTLITHSYAMGLMRWTRDGKRLPWEGRGDNRGNWGGMMTFQLNYLAVRGDEIYVIPPGHYLKNVKDWRFTTLNVFGMDQKEKRTAIWQLTRGSIPRVDRRGNIYIASMMKPPGRVWPDFFDGKLGPPEKIGGFSPEYWYSYMYGGIAKFPPEGGAIWHKEGEIPASAIGQPPPELLKKPKIEIGYMYYNRHLEKGYLQNAMWFRFGFSPYSETYPIGTPTCMCEGAGFDVDGWGRVFFPNLGQFRVEVIDNNSNFIGKFGAYGNEGSLGNGKVAGGAMREGRAKGPHPDIPLAWPSYVAVSDTHAYVNDTLNRRVARVRLGWRAGESLEVSR